MDSWLPIITYIVRTDERSTESRDASLVYSQRSIIDQSGTQLARTFSIENSSRNPKSFWLLMMDVVGPTELESVTSTVSR